MRPFYKWQAPVSIEKLDLSLSEHRVYISGGTNEAMWPAKESIFLYLGGHLWNVQANNTVIHFFIMTYGKTKNIPKHPVLEKPVVVFSVSDGWALPTMKPLDKKEEEEE